MPLEKDSTPATICRHLRSKMFYVNIFDSQESFDDNSSTQYWCLKTMQPIGPDEKFVHYSCCKDQTRSCFESPEI